MTRRYRYVGPDPAPEALLSLDPGEGAALGSDYCVHLLPSPERLALLCGAAREEGAPLLLLVPWLRDAELRRLLPLLRAVPEGTPLVLSANDWGLLLSARLLFPSLEGTVGRLLSGQKRCPRVPLSAGLSDAGRAWHREGFPGSAAARSLLSAELGARGYHADLLPETDLAAWGSALAAEGGTLFVHLPPAVVTVTDRCPWLGGNPSSSVAACPRHCRSGSFSLSHPSMGGLLLQRGKGRFADPFAGEPLPPLPEGENVALVRYDGVP